MKVGHNKAFCLPNKHTPIVEHFGDDELSVCRLHELGQVLLELLKHRLPLVWSSELYHALHNTRRVVPENNLGSRLINEHYEKLYI